jgi:adenosylcobinamide hydrolase
MGGEGETVDPVLRATVRDGVCRLARPDTRWLSTGHAGGRSVASAAYNVTVPEGWPETDLDAYVRERRERVGFDAAGPTLLTGVHQRHARLARLGPVAAAATVGVSNPAALPVSSPGESRHGGSPDDADPATDRAPDDPATDTGTGPLGTVNLVVATTHSLAPGALANLLAVAVEAKTATLLARTGFPGTTTDAAVVGCDPAGDPVCFSGSATRVGAAARACVRDAVCASLDSRYGPGTDATVPDDVAAAEHGVVTDERATVRPVE